MSRRAAAAATVQPTQDGPTRPRPTDGQGRELDAWGLPLSGPDRVAALAQAGRRDPNHHPEDWTEDEQAYSLTDGQQETSHG